MLRQSLIHALVSRACDFRLEGGNHEQQTGNALVLAPHFDDEVLGCGGTIIRMLAAGYDVHVWFLTDGAASHRHLLEPSKVTEIRQAEAYEATAELGIRSTNITMWGYPDSMLTNSPRLSDRR